MPSVAFQELGMFLLMVHQSWLSLALSHIPTILIIITIHLNLVCKSTQIIVHKMSRDDWRTEQENDSIIGPVINVIKSKKINKDTLSNESKRLLRSLSHLLDCCTEKCLMDNFKRISSSLYYLSHTGNRL